MGVRRFFLGGGFFELTLPEELLWEQIFVLAYNSNGGFTYPINEMSTKHRDWTTKRLVEQKKRDAKNEEARAAGYKKGIKKSRK